jgi:hypothetical protein
MAGREGHSSRTGDRIQKHRALLSKIAQYLERQRLFGYVELKNGEHLSTGETESRLRKHLLSESEIKKWHAPEAVTDVTNSLGEVYAEDRYKILGSQPGVVLLDPKIHHKDPYLFFNKKPVS